MLLEVGRHVALRSGKGLLARVAVRDAIALRVGDLDVVAEDAVVADPQRADAGALALGGLQRREVRARGASGRAEVVEIGVGALTDRAAIRGVCGQILSEETGEAFLQARGCVTRVGTSRDVGSGGQPSSRKCGRIEGRARVANRAEVARRRETLHAPCDEPLEVTHPAERIAKAAADIALGQQRIDRREAAGDLADVDERFVEPGPQQAQPHRRARGVEHLQQGRATAAQASEHLEVLASVSVEAHRAVRLSDPEAKQFRADHDPRPLAVGEHGTRRADRDRDRVDTEPVERDRPGGAAHAILRAAGVEDRGRERRGRRTSDERGGQAPALLHQELGRVEPDHLIRHRGIRRLPGNLNQLHELRVGVERSDADASAHREERHAARHRGGVEQLRLDHHPRAQHSGHLAPDELPGDDLPDLIPHRDAPARIEQLADVLDHRLVRHPAHRETAGGAESPARQGDAEDRGGGHGVVSEHLEEVAEAREHDGVGVGGLDDPVLAKDRRVARGVEVERRPRRLWHRRREMRSPNLRARSHAAAPTCSTCSCQAVALTTRA